MSHALTPESTVQRGPDLVSVRLDDEAMLMSTATGRYYALDAVGQVIWEALGEARTVGFLCEEVASQFEVTHEQCLVDVMAFLGELLADDLVRRLDAGP